MGFRTVAISRGADKEALARELGAHEYVDTQKVAAAEGLQKLGGADLVLATAPNNEAIASTIDGLKPRGKLLIVAAPFEPMRDLRVPAAQRQDHRRLAERQRRSTPRRRWRSARSPACARASRSFKLEQAEQAFAKVMENRVRFRAVLTI